MAAYGGGSLGTLIGGIFLLPLGPAGMIAGGTMISAGLSGGVTTF
jgi:hypothetical protein